MEKNVGEVYFLAINTWAWANWDFKIWPFLVNLGPVDFQCGLPSIINRNFDQNKIEAHISKNVAIMANYRPKIGPGQDATFYPILNGQSSDISIRF